MLLSDKLELFNQAIKLVYKHKLSLQQSILYRHFINWQILTLNLRHRQRQCFLDTNTSFYAIHQSYFAPH